ncbi:hypothetical protein KY284_032454 [Solanum tuberosum]|nr:hypothetical protein KY284_032454 [Solanum tuberosum]
MGNSSCIVATTVNNSKLSPSLASLVACLMSKYPLNVGWIIATEMRDRALNERAGLSFPCMIWKLYLQDNIPPYKYVDKWVEESKVTATSKIKDMVNHLFGAKAEAMGPLVVLVHVPVDIPQVVGGSEHGESSQPSTGAPPPSTSSSQATCTFMTIPTIILERLVVDQRQTQSIVDQIVLKLPQLVQREVLAIEKRLKDEMRQKLVVLENRMDGLEVHVNNQLHAADSIDGKTLKAHLVEMRPKLTKLAEKPVTVPLPVVPDSLMRLLSAPPSLTRWMIFGATWINQLLERENTNMFKEEKRQHKKAQKESTRVAREEEALEQQRRKIVLASASGSTIPDPVDNSQPAQVQVKVFLFGGGEQPTIKC